MLNSSDRIALLREIGSTIAIGATLVFVGLEVRQNTLAVKGATLQAVSQQSLDIVMEGVSNEDLRDAFAAAENSPGDSLTDSERRVLGWAFSAKLRTDENRLRQIELGTLDDVRFDQLTNNGLYRLPYFAEWWEEREHRWSPELRQLVEEEFLPLSRAAASGS